MERAWFFTPSGGGDSAACLTAASTRASFLLSEALNQETGYTANDLPASLMLRVRQMLQAAGSTKPGAGSMPGGLRGELDRDFGLSSTTSLVQEFGAQFMAGFKPEGLPEVAALLQGSLQRARHAAGEPISFDRGHETECAARDMARAMAILVRLCLQNVISQVQGKAAGNPFRGAVASLTAAAGSGRVAGTKGAALTGGLPFIARDGQLALWFEMNWTGLLENPKLRRKAHTVAAVDALDEAAEQALQSSKTPPSKPKTWVGVQLVDQNGQPVPNQRYHIVLPDGSEMDGNLNDAGEVEVDEIDPGQCQISFPDIDAKEWAAA